jgi:hypothetical protein
MSMLGEWRDEADDAVKVLAREKAGEDTTEEDSDDPGGDGKEKEVPEELGVWATVVVVEAVVVEETVDAVWEEEAAEAL